MTVMLPYSKLIGKTLIAIFTGMVLVLAFSLPASAATGSLKVTLAPQEAINAGAQWRVNTGPWRNSGYTETGLPEGWNYLEYKAISGWKAPRNGSVRITAGLLTSVTGTYVKAIGSLRVYITPQGAIDAGAQWRVDGGTWRDSGYTETSLTEGSHYVEFKTVSGWNKPANQSVNVSFGQLTETTGTYIEAIGSLRVNIAPQEAIDLGAKWRVDGGAWRDSGYTQAGLADGNHLVEFNAVNGWKTPSSQTVRVYTGQLTEITGTFIEAIGSLVVNIIPQGAIALGAKWRVDGGAWLDSGFTQAGLAEGDHLVEFNDITGWQNPLSEYVQVLTQQTTTLTGEYIADEYGSLQVDILPQEVVDAGAQWRVDGGAWLDSGTTVNNLPAGYHLVEFKPVAGWNAPVSRYESVTGGQTTVSTQSYTYANLGRIIVDKVTIPAGSTQQFTFTPSYAGAFTLTDAATPHDSGLINPGVHSVSETVPTGWDLTEATCLSSDGITTYNPASINLSEGETVTCTFTNTKRGRIITDKVTIPSGSAEAFTFTPSYGADFTLADADAPNDSGLIPPGNYMVSESVPSGWALTSSNCLSDNGVTIYDPSYIDLSPGETITCTFTNTQRDTIIVEKQTLPDGSSETFIFTGDVAGTVGDGGTIHMSNLSPGAYTSTETVPSGWRLTDISCDDTDSVGDAGAGTATFNLASGETIRCVFTNTRKGSIRIVEDSIPNDGQDFFYATTGSGLNDFSLDDDSDGTLSNENQFSNLLPGAFSVTQGAVTDWSIKSIACTGAVNSTVTTDVPSGTLNINLAAGENLICTYTNTRLGTIVVEKQTVPDGAAGTFTFTGDASGVIGDNGTITSADIPPGQYTSTESVSAGWTLTSIACDDADSTVNLTSRTAIFNVSPGEVTTCTFTNTQLGKIIVDKTTDPPGSTEVFTFDSSYGGQFTLTDAQTPQDSGYLWPGTYSVSEAVSAGWELSSASCVSDDGVSIYDPGSIDLSAGETVTCTFANSKLSSIRIIKDSIPDDPQDFAYTATGTGLSGFSLDDDPGSSLSNERLFANLSPGSYSITEAALSGWNLTDLACTGHTNSSISTDVASRSVSIGLAGGEDIACTFTNTKSGTIIVEKQTDPDGSSQTFTFAGDAPGTIKDNETITVSNLPEGTYQATEVVPAGWELTGIVCDDADSTGDLASSTATFNVALGETVKCTFIDTKFSSITIVKDSEPDDAQDFVFNVSGDMSYSFSLDDDGGVDPALSNQELLSDLGPGSYNVSEAAVSGWRLIGLSCTGASLSSVSYDVANRTVGINLAAGEYLTCTFNNTRLGTIFVDKVTVPPGSSQPFTFTPTYDGGSQFTVTDSQAPYSSGLLAPGTYSVSEEALAGWVSTDATCSSDDGVSTYDPADIQLSAAETVTCTFTNTKLGSLRIVKDSVPDDPQDFSFTTTGTGLSGFTLDDDSDGTFPNEVLFTDLTVGSYSITEATVSGWNLQDIACTGGVRSTINKNLSTGTVSIDLGPGDDVTCTYTNSMLGRIIVDKVTEPPGALDTFTFTPTYDGGSQFTLTDTQTPHDSGLIPPGTYSVSEEALPGWSLTDATCVSDDGVSTYDPANIQLSATETVTCTFTNTMLGSLKIVKDSVPDDPEDFSFTTTGTGLTDFTLDDDNSDSTFPNEKLFTGLLPSSYSVTEVAVSGWGLAGLACTGAVGSTVTTDIATRKATIGLAAGEDVTCTFTNAKGGKIIVKKQTVPGGAAGSFDFTGDAAGSIGDNGTIEVGDLPPGTYSAIEAVPSGWELTDISCDDADSTGDVGAATATFNLAQGEYVTCTFTNTKLGSLRIVKDSVPDDPQDFSFTTTGTGLSGFTLDDDSDGALPNEALFTDLDAGSYTVSEGAVAGWTLVDIACTGASASTITEDVASASVSVDLASGDDITCTFTNTKRGRIIVDKVTYPPGSIQAFTFTPTYDGGSQFTLTDTQAPHDSGLINSGAYSVSEDALPGWEPTSATCESDDGVSTYDPGSIQLSDSETVTCTFTNTELGSIRVVENSDPDDPQDFFYTATGTGLSDFTLDDDADPALSNQTLFAGLSPGNYSITQGGVAGWSLTGLICSGGSGVTTDPATGQVSINLAAGEDIVCTYTNTKLGSIVVEKQTLPDGSTDSFTFSGDVSGAISDNGTITMGDLLPGSYTATESALAGWELTDISCDDGDSTGDTAAGTATFNLAAGETVTCTFTNTKLGSISILEDSVPDDPQDFYFNTTGPRLSSFSLDDDADGTLPNQKLFGSLLPGSYSVSELAVQDWEVTDILCSGATLSVVTADAASGTVSIDLAVGEDVACTFTTTKRGKIIVEKQTLPNRAIGIFDFTGDAIGTISDGETIVVDYLPPGTYQATEAAQAGWELADISCDDSDSTGDVGTGTATFVVGLGEAVTCTFTNRKLGSIRIIKDSAPDDPQDFSYTATGAGLSNFSLDDDADGTLLNEEIFTGLYDGSYSVAEAAVSGWQLTDLSCTGDRMSSVLIDAATGTVSIDLLNGEDIECIFISTKSGSIRVVNDSVPDDAQDFSFTATGAGLTDFTLDDDADPALSNEILFTDLMPGSYSIDEAETTGWRLASLSCTGGTLSIVSTDAGTGVASIGLAPGEDLTCTYTNTTRGRIIVDKVTAPSGWSQTFTFNPSYGSPFTLSDTQAPHDSGLLAPGTYSVTEEASVGWALTGLSCTGATGSTITPDIASGSVSIDLAATEVVTCTFTNTKLGGIKILKDAIPDHAQDFSFSTTGTGLSPFVLDDNVDGTLPSEKLFPNLLPGPYTITEDPIAGWKVVDIVCSGANNSVVSKDVAAGTLSIDLAPAELVICKYTNTQPGTAIIEKQTDPDGRAETFQFTGDIYGTIGDNETIPFNDLVPGTYTSKEVVPQGWELASIVCSDGDSTGYLPTGTVTFRIGPGETVKCTYTNTKLGSIRIVKDAVPDDPQDFAYTVTGSGLSNFVLDDDPGGSILNEKLFTDLRPGKTYTVTEGAVPGWKLTDISCTGATASAVTPDPATGEVSIDLAAGEDLVCTFTNTKQGKIIIEKQTLPDGATDVFTFSGDLAGALSDGESAESGDLAVGTYNSQEAVTPGWSLTDITCDDANSSGDTATATATFNVELGEAVKCTFTNTKEGSITIFEDSVPDDPQDFAYTATGTGLSGFSLDDDTDGTLSNEQLFTGLLPGSYTITEAPVGGWGVSGLSCTGQSASTVMPDITTGTVSIGLAPGEDIICTYTNTKLGSIVVEKQTLPDGATDTFTFTGDARGGIGDNGTITEIDLLPGSYTSTEAASQGWRLIGVSCDDADSTGDVGAATANFVIDPGEVVKCTFINEKLGRILVDVETAPPGATEAFSLTPSYGGQFTLTDAQTPNDSGFLTWGAYSVSETVPLGWELTDATCVSDDGVSTYDPAAIDLSVGETVTCTFANTKRGSILIVKDSLPDDPQDFAFTATGTGLGDFTLDDDADGTYSNQQAFSGLLPGSFSVTEAPVSGWKLTDLTCAGATGSTVTPDLATGAVSIDLAAGEDIACTYTNTKLGSMIIEKQTEPDGATDTFTFTGDTSGDIGDNGTITVGDLLPNTYTVTESALSGWELTDIFCDDADSTGDVATSTATYDVAAGETVKCTFTNKKLGSIRIIKDALPDDPQDFAYTATGDRLSDFTLDDDADGTYSNEQLFSGLLPGNFSITEAQVPGWQVTGLACAGATGSTVTPDLATGAVSIDLAAGEDIACTYTNTKLGSIIIEKQTEPDGATHTFTFTGDASGDIGDNGTITVGDLLPNTYTVTESALSGWELTDISCDDADSTGDVATSTATFDVAAGETVKCTFTNKKLGSIRIIKDAIPDDPQDFAYTATGDRLSDFTLDDDADGTYSNEQLFSGLLPGNFSITEAQVPGWQVTGLACAGATGSTVTPDLATGAVSIDLAAGEDIACTYTNAKLGSIVVEKQTVPDGATDTFTFTGDASGDIGDNGTITVGDLLPGTYTATEGALSSWELTGIACDDADSTGDVGTSTATFNVAAGETVKCVFTNSQYQITPTAYAFGQICVGRTSSAQTFTLENYGSGDINVSVGITGTDAGDFTLTNDGCSGAAVPGGGSCSFDVEFSPSAVGSRTASAEMNITDAAGTTFTVQLSGIGVDCPGISVSAVLLNESFTSGIPDEWTVAGGWSAGNPCGDLVDPPFAAPWAEACTGPATDELTSAAFDASSCSTASLLFSSQFDSNSSADLGRVSASADDGQTWADIYQISTDDGYPVPKWVDLNMDGTAGASKARVRFGRSAAAGTGLWAIDNVWAVCEPAELRLASAVGKTSQPGMVMASSVGTADLSTGSISVTGPDALAFGISSDGCSGQTLATNDTCVVEVVFSPQSAGLKSATLSIPSDDPDAPAVDAPLSGTALRMGDMDNNGSLSIVDALLVARYVAGLPVNGFYPEAGDVDCDGDVDIIDAMNIARRAVGLTVSGWCGAP